jgi:hypothetical protein
MPKLPPVLFGAGGGKKVGAEARWVPCDLAWRRGRRVQIGDSSPARFAHGGSEQEERGVALPVTVKKNPRAVGCLLVVFKHERWSVKSQRPD